MANGCSGDEFNGTFVHEFGHHFSLYHTHQSTSGGNDAVGAEHVPRSGGNSNCSSAGDLLCDTDSDPRGGTTNCVYTDGESDIFGNAYDPPVDNIMSYYSDNCGGTLFTPGQYGRISSALTTRLGHSAYDIDGAVPASVANPSGLTAESFLTSITLNWNDNSSNETGFLLERSEDGITFTPVPEIGIIPNSTSITDTYNLESNTTYWYRLKASNDNPSDYSNTATTATGPSNYTCADAFELTSCGTFNSPGPSEGGGASQGSADDAVWYKFTPPYTGTLDITSCLGGADTRLWLHTGSCGSLIPLDNDDDTCPFNPGSSSYAAELIGVPVTQGNTVFIEWDDRWSNRGFTFTLTMNASNACVGAEVINSPGTYTVQSNSCGGGASKSDAENATYFQFTPPTTGEINISSCDEQVNTRLWVYNGSCGSLSQIASSDDDCSAGGSLGNVAASVIGVSVTSGSPIYLEWDDKWSQEGFDFEINYNNNDCPSNYDLSGNQSSNFDFETDGIITSTQIINGNSIVDYDSGIEIILNPDFEVTLGSRFQAIIDGCGGIE